MTASAQQIINIAKQYLGTKMYDTTHNAIVNKYNSVKPLPAGYAVKTSDDWCDVFVSFVGITAGATNLINRECGVERHIQIFKKMGIWNEDGKIKPRPGDIICFNWDFVMQPNDGWADHIGIVERVEGNTVYTIEGNVSRSVARRSYPVGWGYIRGYAQPKYSGETTTASPASAPKPPSVGYDTLTIDGSWGPATTRALQRYFKCTIVDGVISGQIKSSANASIPSAQFGSGGSNLIRAMQKWLGVEQDGNFGPTTCRALQARMGTTQDGVISTTSDCVREMQKRINANKL